MKLKHSRRSLDLVYAASEHGLFAAIDAETGRVVWSRQLGFTHVSFCCDLPNNDFGITGTAVIDRGRNSIFTMGGDGTLTSWTSPMVRPSAHGSLTHDPTHNYEYGALLISSGTLYVPFAGICDTNP